MYYWGYIFYCSKILELVDSYLLALRKKPLILLHVYHHMVMVWVCWCGLHGKWGMSLSTSVFFNGSVHVAMYYYYFAATISRPPWWGKYLTKTQISQFVTGIFLTVTFLMVYITQLRITWSGMFPVVHFIPGCTGETWAVSFMASVNFSFLLLFVQFFFRKYSSSSTKRKTA
jgi:fatty acid elongase 3